jgi:hypothetical protein
MGSALKFGFYSLIDFFFALFFVPLLGLLNQVCPAKRHKKQSKKSIKNPLFRICG